MSGDITNIQNSTQNSSFDALLKRHDPDIRKENFVKIRGRSDDWRRGETSKCCGATSGCALWSRLKNFFEKNYLEYF